MIDKSNSDILESDVGKYTNLHCHSVYSALDGAASVENIVLRSKALGMKGVALTDHGNMFGAYELNRQCKAHGMKPIFGNETYIAPGSGLVKEKVDGYKPAYHLNLLAYNDTGYKNLIKLTSDSWTKYKYYKPRVDFSSLAQYSEGIVALQACFLPETLVITKNNGRVPIGKINISDVILGKDCKWHKIAKISRREYSGLVVKIITKYGGNFVSTGDHKICIVYKNTNNPNNQSIDLANYHTMTTAESIVMYDIGRVPYMLLPVPEDELIPNIKSEDVITINNKKYLLNRIDRIKYYEYKGPVYCLRAAHGRSFTTSAGVVSNCIGGMVAQFFLEGKVEEAIDAAKKFKDIFGDRYYLEQTYTGLKQQDEVNNFFKTISKKLDIPLVITTDSHYTWKDESSIHAALVAINVGASFKNPHKDKKNDELTGSDKDTDESGMFYTPKKYIGPIRSNTY